MFENLRNWIHALSPTCHDVAELQSRALDGPLPFRDWLGMNLHLPLCRWCRRYARQIQFLQEALRTEEDRLVEESDCRLPPQARAQLEEMLQRNSE